MVATLAVSAGIVASATAGSSNWTCQWPIQPPTFTPLWALITHPGQVNIDERLLSGHQNENILFGFDSIPFLATSFEDSERPFEAAKGPLSRRWKRKT